MKSKVDESEKIVQDLETKLDDAREKLKDTRKKLNEKVSTGTPFNSPELRKLYNKGKNTESKTNRLSNKLAIAKQEYQTNKARFDNATAKIDELNKTLDEQAELKKAIDAKDKQANEIRDELRKLMNDNGIAGGI